MKDIKTSAGGQTSPGGVDLTGQRIAGVVIRNLGENGRRIGIYTASSTPIVANGIHAADYAFVDDAIKTIPELPEGFSAGYEVELSPERYYQQALTHRLLPGSDTILGKLPNSGRFVEMSDKVFNPAGAVGGNNFGLVATASELRQEDVLGAPAYISLTVGYAGVNHHIGLDVSKHVARITADLNYQLGLIHPKLKAYVNYADEYQDAGKRDLYFMFFVSEDIGQIKLPMTDISYNMVGDEEAKGYIHLNNSFEKTVIITTDSVTQVDEPNPITSFTEEILPDMSTLFADAVEINNGSAINNDGANWRWEPTIPKANFKPYFHDPRYRIALVKLNPLELYNSAWSLIRADYRVNAQRSFADILVHGENTGGKWCSIISKNASLAAGYFTAGVGSQGIERFNNFSDLASHAVTIVQEYDLEPLDEYYIAIVAPATDGKESTPFFRNAPTADVQASLLFQMKEYPDHEFSSNATINTTWAEHADAHPVGQFNTPFHVEGVTGQFIPEDIVGGKVYQEGGDKVYNVTDLVVNETKDRLSFTTELTFQKMIDLYGYSNQYGGNFTIHSIHEDVTARVGYLTATDFKVNVTYPPTDLSLAMPGNLRYITSRPDYDPDVPWDIEGIVNGDPDSNPFKYASSVSWEFGIVDGALLIPKESGLLLNGGDTGNEWVVGLDATVFEVMEEGELMLRVRATAVFPWLTQPKIYEGLFPLEVRGYVEPPVSDIPVTDLVVNLPRTVSAIQVVDLDTGETLVDIENLESFENDEVLQEGVTVRLFKRPVATDDLPPPPPPPSSPN